MTNQKFDIDSALNTFRETFGPVFKVQQKGVQALERLARYQFAVAGDYLDWTLAHAQVGVTSSSLTEGVAQHTELNSRLSAKLRARAQELSQIATETQGEVSHWFNQTSAEVVRKARKAA
jgi:phasin family protein